MKKLFFIVALVMTAGTIVPTENDEQKKPRTWTEWWNDTKAHVHRNKGKYAAEALGVAAVGTAAYLNRGILGHYRDDIDRMPYNEPDSYPKGRPDSEYLFTSPAQGDRIDAEENAYSYGFAVPFLFYGGRSLGGWAYNKFWVKPITHIRNDYIKVKVALKKLIGDLDKALKINDKAPQNKKLTPREEQELATNKQAAEKAMAELDMEITGLKNATNK
jgi:hypothetical protein